MWKRKDCAFFILNENNEVMGRGFKKKQNKKNDLDRLVKDMEERR